ncbi:MAG: porin [Burkholderiales bacterium]|nr:porin [Burkholderiales bacterium]
MNKKLLAVAVASAFGAFAAPVAMADTSNVTIYGVINMSVDSVDGGSGNAAGTCTAVGNTCPATAERRTRISSNNSNIGFKGTEDLGNGLSAIWQYESAISFDTQARNDQGSGDGTGTTGSRNTFAGFSSKTMGNLTFGNQESPMKTSISKLDMFGNTIADYRTLIGTQVRMASSALYASPSFNGFDAKIGYSARNEAGNDSTTGSVSDPSYWSGSVTYANGPILAAVAHEVEKAVTDTATGTKQKTTRAGFGYNFGVAKVGIGYNTTKLDTTALSVTSNVKVNSWMVSGAYTMGKTTLKAQYVKSSDTSGSGATATSTSQGAKQWTIGADYTLSKRTNLYALYTVLKNDTNSTRTLGGNATVLGASTGVATVSAASAGSDPKAISVGFVHSF